MSETRVPEPDTEFDEYLNGTADYLLLTPGGASTPPNWERLNLLAAENTQWQDYKTDWNSKFGTVKSNTLNGIRDTNATKAKNDAKDAFTNWVNDPAMNKLTRIEGSPNITNNDRTVFNIKERDTTLTPRPHITKAPYVDMKGEDGGVVLITCRVESDSTRSSMHPDADDIEMRYVIMEPDAVPPATASECPSTADSKKALFRFSDAIDYPGKRIHAFLRWHNGSEEDKSSPWSQRETVIIGD